MVTEWEAVYNDKTSLKQFNADGSENLFKEIRQNELFEFRLHYNSKVISFFPKTGTFGLNGFLLDTDISCKCLDYRLIFFARRRKQLGTGTTESIYFLGFQANVDGKNIKRLISIQDNTVRMENG